MKKFKKGDKAKLLNDNYGMPSKFVGSICTITNADDQGRLTVDFDGNGGWQTKSKDLEAVKVGSKADKGDSFTKKEVIKDLEKHIKHLKKRSTKCPKSILLAINYDETHSGMVVGNMFDMGMGFTHILEKEPNLIAMTGAAIVALATRGAASQ